MSDYIVVKKRSFLTNSHSKRFIMHPSSSSGENLLRNNRRYNPYSRAITKNHTTNIASKTKTLVSGAHQHGNNDASVAAVNCGNEDSEDYESLCQAIFGAYLSILDRKAVKQKEM